LDLYSIDRFEDGVVQLHYRVQKHLDDAASHANGTVSRSGAV
jgi:hypothetical protein